MKTTFLNISVVILLSTIFFTSCKNGQQDNKLESVVNFEKNDKVMSGAVANAHATTDSFLHVMANPVNGESDFFVKYPYPTPNGDAEHIWISAMEIEGNKIKGIISNEAESKIGVNFGDTVLVSKDSISDWSYKQNGYTYGGYTLRVLRNTLSAEERTKFDSLYQFK